MSYLRSVWLFIGLLLSLTTILSAQSTYKYSYMPKMVYKNQLFPVTVVGPDNYPTLTFDTSSTIQPLFTKPLEVKNGNDTFYTFYFKAGKTDVRIPQLFISSQEGDTSLEDHHISLGRLKPVKHFSGVLAADLKLKGQQVSNYDEKNHIVTLTLEAYEANIEDMALKNISEFGVEHIKRDNAKVTAEFYAVLPRAKKVLEFCYYNTIKKRYVSLKVPVEVADSSVTTQSDLNPKVDAFERLKRYTLIAFSLFFLIMFMWRRDFFYLILAVISLITLLTFYIPHKQICVKQGAPLYIIPTQTSTIGTRIETNLDTMLLGERGDFKKVEYKKGIIGWIKNEDICDN
ncbi:MAG TPA: hypothetical protein ENK39_00255 [Epsilonproteobacteria bacterium]|nr:hypothetical protein [Campylobacterota bacterium]